VKYLVQEAGADMERKDEVSVGLLRKRRAIYCRLCNSICVFLRIGAIV
jgi:hypothetical protein